jgi:hypothetical protein
VNTFTEEDLKALPETDRFCETPDDLVVACASFEDRSASIPLHLPVGYKAFRALVYTNHEFLCGHAGPATRKNLYRMVDALARHTGSVRVAEGSWLCAENQWEVLRQALDDCLPAESPTRSVTLDVTTFNRESLLVTVLLLRTRFPNARIRLLYAAPTGHGSWLSRGFRAVRNVIGFAGTQYPSRPTLLVVLSGFESERTLKLIEEHEPTLVLLGIGDPPTREEFRDRNESEQRLVLGRQGVRKFSFPTNDLGACHAGLVQELSGYSASHNIILAPMSTKLSTLAVLTVCETYPHAQVTYCLPGEYNIDEYSIGVSTIYVTTMPPRPPSSAAS